MEQLQELLAVYSRSDAEGPSDELTALEEALADAGSAVQLMKDEEPRLRELLAAADQISEDTKLAKLLEVVKTRFGDRSVLFFTDTRRLKGLCCPFSLLRLERRLSRSSTATTGSTMFECQTAVCGH